MSQKKVYILASYFAKPKNKKMTSVKGYMKNPDNVAWDEQIGVSVGLKDKQLATAKVVLNINDQLVVKNGFNTNKSFMELFEYFYSASPREISQQLRMAGITVEEKKDGNQGNVPTNQATDVSGEAEAGARSEPAATGEPV
jgi:hypothetical protein